MLLTLETTTGLLTPSGVAQELPRGGDQPIFIRLLASGVATLLADGVPLSLKLYDPADLVTPLATVTNFAKVVASSVYKGSLASTSGNLAYIASRTLLAKISYGDPSFDSQLFHVRYGVGGGAAAGTVTPIIITQPAGPVRYTEFVGSFTGQLAVDKVSGLFRAAAPCQILGMRLSAEKAPTGADVRVDLIDQAANELGKIGVLAANQKQQETDFAMPVTLAIGDLVQPKIKQIGSNASGGFLTVSLKIKML